MQIAFEYLKRGDAADRAALGEAGRRGGAECVPGAQGARPGAARNRRHRGRHPRAAQAGLKIAPDSPGLHFTLARAYQRAGRLDDAESEREEFTRLDRLARTQRSGAQSVGGHMSNSRTMSKLPTTNARLGPGCNCEPAARLGSWNRRR